MFLINFGKYVNKAIGYNIYNKDGNVLLVRIDINRYRYVDYITNGFIFDNICFSYKQEIKQYDNVIGIMRSLDIVETNENFNTVNFGISFNISKICNFITNRNMFIIKCILKEDFLINNSISYYKLNQYMDNCANGNYTKINFYKNKYYKIEYNKNNNIKNPYLINKGEIIDKFGFEKNNINVNKKIFGKLINNNNIKQTNSKVYDYNNIPAKPIIEKLNEINDVDKKNNILKGIKNISKSLTKIIFMRKRNVIDVLKKYPIELKKLRPISIVPAYFKAIENSFIELKNDLINNCDEFIYSYLPGKSIDKVFEQIFSYFDNG